MSKIYEAIENANNILEINEELVVIINNKCYNELSKELYEEGKKVPEKIGNAKIIKCDYIGKDIFITSKSEAKRLCN